MRGTFVTSKEDVKNFLGASKNNNQEGIYVCWRTSEEAIKRVLPPQLEMVTPIVSVYILNIQESTMCARYQECSISIPVTHNGVLGIYFPSMLLDGPGAEMGTYVGRDVVGMTKKFADVIRIQRFDTYVHAYAERHGTRVFDVKMDITGEYNSPLAEDFFGDITKGSEGTQDAFFYKYDVDKNKDSVVEFTNGRLISVAFDNEYEVWDKGVAEVTLQDSITDPWAEFEVLEVLGAAYSRNATDLCKSEVVEEGFDMTEVMPYLLTGKFDKGPINKNDRIFF